MAEDVWAPGSGLLTATAKVPAVGALPVAVSCVEEMKVVFKVAAPRSTCDPLTKLLPVAVTVKFPTLTDGGLRPVNTGIGFSTVTALVAKALESATLLA
jgi:hypothetical protein